MDKKMYFFVVAFFGWTGIHKFIEKKVGMGFLYLFTLGLFYVGWIIDAVNAYKDAFSSGSTKTVHYDYPQSRPQINSAVNQNSDLQSELMRIDAMSSDGWAFERYCADLLLKNGFSKAEVTTGSGDYGVDILAEKDGISYAIQCKCYSNPVGNKAVQEAFSGKEYYKKMVAVVLTNSTFTQAANTTAEQTRVMLWDRTKLSEMISNTLRTTNRLPV